MALRNRQKLPKEPEGLGVDSVVVLPPVAVLDNRHPAALEVEKLLLGLFQGGQGKSRRTCVEVVDPHHCTKIILAWLGVNMLYCHGVNLESPIGREGRTAIPGHR